ncbi:MAG: type II toxin-antitoxin system VapC family toxin [Acidobacteria bacterium]|nr:type II toxin-antitoxin system VapC family toxin [Acidobacteriota bacterium]
MHAKVIDSSALSAILFGEPGAEELAERMQGCSLIAPLLLRFEIASVCLKKLRRYPKQQEGFLTAFQIFLQMEILHVEVDLEESIALAQRADLTLYDASYLWLARELGVELISLDEKLQKASQEN